MRRARDVGAGGRAEVQVKSVTKSEGTKCGAAASNLVGFPVARRPAAGSRAFPLGLWLLSG
jgi:hypothetical protein